jgi:hypothetical protein
VVGSWPKIEKMLGLWVFSVVLRASTIRCSGTFSRGSPLLGSSRRTVPYSPSARKSIGAVA